MDIQKRNKRQNDWQKENKWRPNISLPKNYEIPVKERANGNVSNYIKTLIDKDIANACSGGGQLESSQTTDWTDTGNHATISLEAKEG